MKGRWQIVEDGNGSCVGGVTISGAGTSSVNGEYCPDGTFGGQTVWTKIGGVRLEDSIVWAVHEGEALGYYVITSGGTFQDDPLNALYSTFGTPGDDTIWSVYDIFSGGGSLPAPSGTYNGGTGTDDYVIRDVEPLNAGAVRFTRERDLSVGLIDYRRKLTTALKFGGDDYKYFHRAERNGTRRCEEFKIRFQVWCRSGWKTFWRGTFSAGAGSWDLDHCIFEVKPEVLDQYTCIMRAMNKKVNALAVEASTVTSVIWPSTIEVQVFDMASYPVPPFPQPEDLGYAEVDTQVVTRPVMGLVCSTPDDINMTIYWRERVERPCVDGSSSAPPGTGWVLEPQSDLQCDPDGVEAWVRPPTISWPWADNPLVVGPAGHEVTLPTSPECAQWIQVGVFECPGQFFAGIFICADSAEDFVTNTRGRTVQSVMSYALSSADCGTLSLVSDFFEWDPVGDAVGYVSGMNYVTGTTNQHNQWVMVQKSDAIDPDSSNAATKGEITLKELFVLFATGPRVFWRIVDGVVRLEHWTYWTSPVGLDVTEYGSVELAQYAHLNTDIPRYERPSWMEAQGSDFVGTDIVYSGPCVTAEDGSDVKEYKAGPFTTDLSYVSTTPDAISKDGFVLLATTLDDTEYSVILGTGALSGSLVTNAPLSWANLERDFWTWDRFLPEGRMNGQDVEFDGFVPNIEQKGVRVPICCDILDFDAFNRVNTRLTEKLKGATAIVHREEYDAKTGWATYTLRYPY